MQQPSNDGENLSVENVKGQQRARLNKYTIDDIRENLKKQKNSPATVAASNKKRGSHVEILNSEDVTSASRKRHSVSKQRRAAADSPKNSSTTTTAVSEEKYVELTTLCEEILSYCHIVDNSRAQAVYDTVSLRGTVRELEKLLDSARQRELEHLEQVEQHRESLSQFEKKYYSLKSRAKTHIKECQEDRDSYRKELESTAAKLKQVENELQSVQSKVGTQSKELEAYREIARNMPSEKELNNMSLRLRKLEDENGKLATERAKLIQQLDETISAKRTDDRQSQGGGNCSTIQATAELQGKLKDAEAKLRESQRVSNQYKEYCEQLLDQLDMLQEAS